MIPILYTGNLKTGLGLKVKNIISEQNYDLKPCSDLDRIPTSSYIMTPDAFLIRGVRYSVTELWHNYLKEKDRHQQVKLITLGYRNDINHPNYINVLRFDEKFNKTIHTALPALSMPELPAGFPDIGKFLSPFYNGHDFNDSKSSIMETLILLKTKCNILHHLDKLDFSKAEIEETITQVKTLWSSFENRWFNYKSIFNACPFIEEKHKIQKHVDALIPFYNTDVQDQSLYTNCNCYERLEEIHSIISKMQTYVSVPSAE